MKQIPMVHEIENFDFCFTGPVVPGRESLLL